MKFLTYDNWRKAQDSYWGSRVNWHRWFAWHPVKLDDETWVWLETVYRRRRISPEWKASYWKYTTLDDVTVMEHP